MELENLSAESANHFASCVEVIESRFQRWPIRWNRVPGAMPQARADVHLWRSANQLVNARLNHLEPGACLHRREFERNLPTRRARKPEENFPADALRADRTLPRAVQDRYAHRATARTIRVLLSFGRADASNPPAKRSMEEILLRRQAIHPRPFPVADSVARNHPASVRVQLPQSCREHVRQ